MPPYPGLIEVARFSNMDVIKSGLTSYGFVERLMSKYPPGTYFYVGPAGDGFHTQLMLAKEDYEEIIAERESVSSELLERF